MYHDRPGVDPPEEVTGTGPAKILQRLGDRHLDVLLGDLVGSTCGIDGPETFDHPIARRAREREVSPLCVEVGEEIGRHGVGQLSGV